MDVKTFITNWVEKNTLIRLWYKIKGGHEEVIIGDKPMMEHKLINSEWADKKVVGVTDILGYTNSHHVEAVNLIIERDG